MRRWREGGKIPAIRGGERAPGSAGNGRRVNSGLGKLQKGPLLRELALIRLSLEGVALPPIKGETGRIGSWGGPGRVASPGTTERAANIRLTRGGGLPPRGSSKGDFAERPFLNAGGNIKKEGKFKP